MLPKRGTYVIIVKSGSELVDLYQLHEESEIMRIRLSICTADREC